MDSQFHEPPFLDITTKTSYCSKFKKYLEDSVKLVSDSLTSLELFIDGVKSVLDTTMCSHYSFTPYNEWALNYLITTTLCPPEMNGHQRYTTMCVDFNDFGLMLHQFIWTGTPIEFALSHAVYNELRCIRHVKCGWTLFQEFVWACSPHMNGPFRDYCHNIHLCLPTAGELIAIFFIQVQ
jgi:hypothetical protein